MNCEQCKKPIGRTKVVKGGKAFCCATCCGKFEKGHKTANVCEFC